MIAGIQPNHNYTTAAESAVQIRNLTLSSTGGILDPDDSVADVLDDREQIIAIYDEQDSPPPMHPYRDAASSIGTGSPDPFIPGAYGGRNSAAGSSIGSKFRDSGRSSSPSHGRRQESEQNLHSVEITDLKNLPASNLVVGGHRDSLRDSGRHSAQPAELETEVVHEATDAEADRHYLRKREQQGRSGEFPVATDGSLPHGFSQFSRSSARKSRFTDKWLEAADRIEEDYQLNRVGDDANEDTWVEENGTVDPQTPTSVAATGHSPTTSSGTGGNHAMLAETLQRGNTRRIGRKMTISLVKGSDGLGFSVTSRDNVAGGEYPIYVKNILPRGAAVIDGRLKAGDRLLEINGSEVTGLSQQDVVQLLRGVHPGQAVELLISRQETSSPVLPRHMPTEPKTEELAPADSTKKLLTFEIPLNFSGSAGLGLSVKGRTTKGKDDRVNDEGIFVKNILKGGAVDQDGRLFKNDQLVSVDGVELMGYSNEKAMAILRQIVPQVGTNAKSVKISVLRLVDAKGNPMQTTASPHPAQKPNVDSSGDNSFMRRLIDSYTADLAKYGSNSSIPSDSSTLKEGKNSTTDSTTARVEVPSVKNRPGNILSREFTGANGIFPQTYRVNGNAEYAVVMKSPTINGQMLSSEIEILDDEEPTNERVESGYSHIIPVSGGIARTPDDIIPPQRNQYGSHSLKREYSGNRVGNYEVIADDMIAETSSRSDVFPEDVGKEVDDDNFVRDAPGRQSMSEKRRGPTKKDPGTSDFYQKILHKRQGSAPALKDEVGAEVSINGERLQVGKSQSMESLSPAVPSLKKNQKLLIHEEIVGMKTPPSKSPNIHLKNKVNRTRPTNDSFRTAVDKSVPNVQNFPGKENGIDVGDSHPQMVVAPPSEQPPGVPTFPDFLVSRTTAYRDIHGSPVKEKPEKGGFFNKLFKHGGKQTSSKNVSVPVIVSKSVDAGKPIPDLKKSHMEEQQRIKEEYEKLKRQQQHLPPNFYQLGQQQQHHQPPAVDTSFERFSRPSKQPSGWRPQSQISSDEYHPGYPPRSQSGGVAFDNRPVWQLQQNTLGRQDFEESGNCRWVYDNKLYRSLERPSPHSTIDADRQIRHRLAQNSAGRLIEEVEPSRPNPSWAVPVRTAPVPVDMVSHRHPAELNMKPSAKEQPQRDVNGHQQNVSPPWTTSNVHKSLHSGSTSTTVLTSQTAPDRQRSTQSLMGPPPPWAPPPLTNPDGGRPAFTPNFTSHPRPELRPPGTFSVMVNVEPTGKIPTKGQTNSSSQLVGGSNDNYQQYLREHRRSGGGQVSQSNRPRPASNFVEYSFPRNSGRHQQQPMAGGQPHVVGRRDVTSVIYEVPPADYNNQSNQLRPTAQPRRNLPNGESQGVTLPMAESRKSAFHNGNERIVERPTIEYPPYAQKLDGRNGHSAPPVAPKPKLTAATVTLRHQQGVELESSRM